MESSYHGYYYYNTASALKSVYGKVDWGCLEDLNMSLHVLLRGHKPRHAGISAQLTQSLVARAPHVCVCREAGLVDSTSLLILHVSR